MGNNYDIAFVSVLTDNNRLLPYFAVITLLIVATIIDLREYKIPNKLVLAGAFVGLAFSLLDSPRGFLNSIAGGITVGLILLMIYYMTKGGIGLGDVKLFGCVGIYLGLSRTVSAMLIAAVLSGLFSMILICINRENKKRELPFAPFILVGVLAAIIF